MKKGKNIFYSGKHTQKTATPTVRKEPVMDEDDFMEEADYTPTAKRPEKKRRLHMGRVIACVLAVVIIGGVAGGLMFYNSKLNALNYDGAKTAENVSASVKESLAKLGETVEGTVEANADKQESDESPDDTLDVGDHEVKAGGGTKTAKEAVKDNNIVNILVIGSDMKIPGTQDRGRADAVMLVSLNKDTGDIKLCSFERAMGVPVKGQKDSKLNDTLNIGDAILIQNIISECFSVNIDGFVHVDYDSFPQIIDAIGGIDLVFDEAEARTFNGRITLDARSNFVAQKGQNHLAGYETLIYCRLRDGDDNWGRQARTRAVASAAVDKVKTLSLKELNSLADTILPLIHTNLTKTQISSILLSAPKFLSPEISQLMIPDKEQIWVYHGEGDEAMYGYDFDYETDRLQQFIFGKK